MPPSPKRLQNISFYILLTVVGFTVVFMFLPFFKVIALAGILAVLFYPIKLKVAKYIKNNTVTSLITLVLGLLIILIPLYIIGQLVFNEIVNVYNQAKAGGYSFNQASFISHLPPLLQNFAHSASANLSQKLSDFAGNAFASISAVLSNIAGFIVSFILLVFTLYYFLKDGNKLRDFIEKIFPLSQKHETLLAEKLEMAVNGVVQGSFTVALLQGTVSTIGFFLFGVPNPILWGVFTVLASLVPTVGTLLSLVPAIAYLFLSGQTGAGIGMTIWAFASIQSIDNFISPRVIGHKTNLHPLITLLSILGGISIFGYLGFLIGPILMAILMSLLDIYVMESSGSKKIS